MKPKHKGRSNRIFRHYRIRKKVSGNPERPRLSVAPSINHIEAQIIDDYDQKTLVGFSTKSKDFKKASGFGKGGNVEAAVAFGAYVAEKARQKGIDKVVFDRGGYLYHGRIKAFAEAAREKGLSF
ncbi:MAG: 50S ribosomal protein L18 [Candidatus Omnitrophica bacterium]|nr:50S ribosomal protein L18 [Candidatus Omnitrophota bacterium]